MGCKRSAQREIRRLDALLIKFEEGRWWERLNGKSDTGRSRRDEVIEQMEARMKALLEANGADDE
jgi:hypothetical protein